MMGDLLSRAFDGSPAAMALNLIETADLDADELRRLELDPTLRYAGVGLGTAAALTLYDNYLSLLMIVKDPRLRRLVNDPDRGYGIEGEPGGGYRLAGFPDRLESGERAEFEAAGLYCIGDVDR